MTMFVRSLCAIPALVILAFALVPGGMRSPSIAHACTGSVDDLTLDNFVSIANAIAIVEVTEVGGAANETPPLPPGTPIRSIAGPGYVPDGFDFYGYRATTIVRRTIVGTVSGAIEVDKALRAGLEETVRRWEAGERFAPCFFGAQHRYEADASYLVFLGNASGGWDTIAAYPLDGDNVIFAVGDEAMPLQRKHLILGNALFQKHFSPLAARNSGPGLTNVYGDLWFIEEPRVPLETVLAAIATARRGISPPTTGDAGLLTTP